MCRRRGGGRDIRENRLLLRQLNREKIRVVNVFQDVSVELYVYDEVISGIFGSRIDARKRLHNFYIRVFWGECIILSE